MIAQNISWKSINNNVSDRMIDGSLAHLFTARRRIRRKTQLLNRELRQLSCVNSYKKYVAIKKEVSRMARNDDDTDEDYFSNDDFYDGHNFPDATTHHKNNDVDEIFDRFDEIEKNESFEDATDDMVYDQCSDEVSESEHNTDDMMNSVQLSDLKIDVPSETEDIPESFSMEFSETPGHNTDIVTIPGDSGIDEDSVDSLSTNSNRVVDVRKPKVTVEEVIEPMPSTPKKSRLKVTCTEIVTSKYKILRDDRGARTNDIESMTSMKDRQNDDFPEQTTVSDIEARNAEKSHHPCTPLTVPSEIDSLKYILTNLRIHNRYGNDSLTDEYLHDRVERDQFDVHHTSGMPLTRMKTLDDLIENESLVELVNESTLTTKDISDDEDIFLMEIPKSVLDDQDLQRKRMKIKKNSVLIDGNKYQAYRKENEDISCIFGREQMDTPYEIGNIKPKATIVLRQKPSEPNPVPTELISNIAHDGNQYTPFPIKLKRRNPLVLDSCCLSSNFGSKNDNILNQKSSLKMKVERNICDVRREYE